MNKDKEKKLKDLEKKMASANFWVVKDEARKVVQEYTELKEHLASRGNEYPAIISIIAGAGGDDSEDFVKILANMYRKYCENKNFSVFEIDSHPNEHDGYKNISLDVSNKKAYDLLKYETGVHRLVRISPFNSSKQRHTSFALVDVTPKLPKLPEIEIEENDIEIETTNAGGPGGQNVNKRETAVRIKHIASGIIVRVQQERTQLQNKEIAFEILRGKLFSLMKQKRVEKLRDMSFDKRTGIEWGNQIRSYVLHPYQLVKEERIDYEEQNPEMVFDGKLDGFISALKEKFN